MIFLLSHFYRGQSKRNHITVCGIVGIYHFTKQPVAEENLKRMINVIRHRGPDDAGFKVVHHVGLGHCRLSIIDLSPAGHQPMTNEDQTLWISYNGEIYNYKELRAELMEKGHHFKSQTDTEVILHAFEQWGKDCVHKFNGMFAFCIWNMAKQEFFLARDRIGIKPLYYYQDNQKFIFASEIKAMLEDNTIERIPNLEAIHDYLIFNYQINDHTFFHNIFSLPAGYRLVVNEEGIISERYWNLLENSDTERLTEKQLNENLFHLLTDSVKLRLHSDVPIGAHLSGGLDSSTIVTLMNMNLTDRVNTFTGRFAEGEQFDESYYATLLAKKYDLIQHFVEPSLDNFISEFSKIVWLLDQPTVGVGVFPQYFVCKLAKQWVTVVLGGQGGDELFGGYVWYQKALSENCLFSLGSKLSHDGKARGKVGLQYLSTLGYKEFLSAFVRRNFVDFETRFARIRLKLRSERERRKLLATNFLESIENVTIEDRTKEAFDDIRVDNFVKKMMYWDVKYFLAGLLTVEDRTSMAVSLESRVPLLDYRIVEFAFNLPARYKFNGFHNTKLIVKNIMKSYLPDEIINRKDKIGFTVPISRWLRTGLKDYTTALLFSEKFKNRNLFNQEFIENLVRKHLHQVKDNSNLLWSLLNLETWFRIFIDKN